MIGQAREGTGVAVAVALLEPRALTRVGMLYRGEGSSLSSNA